MTAPVPPAPTDKAALSDAELAALEALRAATTEEPWAIWPDLKQYGLIAIGNAAGVLETELWTEGEAETVAHVYVEEDADLIVAAVNALPRLVAALRAAREELMSARAERVELIAERDQLRAREYDTDAALEAALGDRWSPDRPPAAGVQQLAEERDQAQAELARLVELGEERYVQLLVDETAIKSMSIRNGTMDMDLSVAKQIGAAFVGAARAMLGDAPNYSETVAWDVKVAEQPEMYTLVVQRHAPGTLTPHQARQKAEKERDEARAALAGAEQATTDARQTIAEQLQNVSRSFEGSVAKALDEAGTSIRLGAADHTMVWRVRDALAADVPAAPVTTGDCASGCTEHATCRADAPAAADELSCPCPAVGVFAKDCPQHGDHPDALPARADDHYLSTACYHGHHGVCGKAQHANGDPSEPHCKFCETRCSCPKHTDPLAPCTGGARKRRHHPSCARPDDDSHIGWCGPNAGVPAAGEAEVTQP